MRKTACRAVNTNSENGNRAIELEQQVGAPLNGNKRAVPLLDSATTSIVLPDGRPYPLGQIKDNFNRKGCKRAPVRRLPQPGSIEPEPLDFGAFPDGTLVEVVKSPSQSGRLLFLIWNAGDVKVEKFFHYGGSQFVPPRVDVSLLRRHTSANRNHPMRQCGRAPFGDYAMHLRLHRSCTRVPQIGQPLRALHVVSRSAIDRTLPLGDWSLQCGQNALAQSPACVLSACCYGERYFSGGVVLSSQRNHADVAHR